MLCKSAVNAAYLLICFFIFLVKCGKFCSFNNKSYKIKLYELYLFNYVASALALVDLLMEIVIIFQRLFVILNKSFIEKRNVFNFLVPIVILAFVVYSPYCYFLRIESVAYSQHPTHLQLYNLSTRLNTNNPHFFELKVANKLWYEIFELVATASFRGSLLLLLIILLNIISCYFFKYRLRQKEKYKNFKQIVLLPNPSFISKTTNESTTTTNPFQRSENAKKKKFRANENFNQMIIWQSILYLLGNMFFIALLIILPVIDGRRSSYYLVLMIITNTLLFSSMGLNILVYISFNRKFKRTLIRLIISG